MTPDLDRFPPKPCPPYRSAIHRLARWFLLGAWLIGMLLSACAAPRRLASPDPSGATLQVAAPTIAAATATATRPATPTPEVTRIPAQGDITPSLTQTPSGLTYMVQSGDSLALVAQRFGVAAEAIRSSEALPAEGLLAPGQVLWLPTEAASPGTELRLLPDSEVVYSPAAVDFDGAAYLKEAGGYLSRHQEYLGSEGWASAAAIIQRVASENSINPRLLISLLEYTCGCVLGDAPGELESGFVLGVEEFRRKTLYGQLWWAANQLSAGYYGWREGRLAEIPLPDGTSYRPAPGANAGSVALVYYFSQLWAAQNLAGQMGPQTWATMHPNSFDRRDWRQALSPQYGFLALHQRMFGDAWEGAAAFEPLLPARLRQPELRLPFEPGRVWSFTSGPHQVWESEGAWAALDFAPSSAHGGCDISDAWATAAGDGPVVRIGNGLVLQDLDQPGAPADGIEQTGWSILYMHIASQERVAPGTYLHAGDPIGHPSCEGGPATGTHLHIARKYNGEWIAAAGPLPFVMDGWTTQAGSAPYQGTLTRDGQTVTANIFAPRSSQLSRPVEATSPAP